MAGLIENNREQNDPRLKYDVNIPVVNNAAFRPPAPIEPTFPKVQEPAQPLGDFIPEVNPLPTTPTPELQTSGVVEDPAALTSQAQQQVQKDIDWLTARQREYQLPQYADFNGVSSLAQALQIKPYSPDLFLPPIPQDITDPAVIARQRELQNKGFNVNPTQNVASGQMGSKDGWNILEQVGGLGGFVGRYLKAFGGAIADPDFLTIKGVSPEKQNQYVAREFKPETFNANERTLLQGLQPTQGGVNLGKARFGDYGSGLVGAVNYGMDNFLGGNTIRGVIADIKRNNERAKRGLAPEWNGFTNALSGKSYSFVDPNSPLNVTGTNETGASFWGRFGGGLVLDAVTDINPVNALRKGVLSGVKRAATRGAVNATRGEVVQEIAKAAIHGLDNPIIDSATRIPSLIPGRKGGAITKRTPSSPTLGRKDIGVAKLENNPPNRVEKTPLLAPPRRREDPRLPPNEPNKDMSGMRALYGDNPLAELPPAREPVSPNNAPKEVPSPSAVVDPKPVGVETGRVEPTTKLQEPEQPVTTKNDQVSVESLENTKVENVKPESTVLSEAPSKPVETQTVQSTGAPKPAEDTSLEGLFQRADDIGSKYQDGTTSISARREANNIVDSTLGEVTARASGKVVDFPTPKQPDNVVPMVRKLREIKDEVSVKGEISDENAALLKAPVAVPTILKAAEQSGSITVGANGTIKKTRDAIEEAQRELIRLRIEQNNARSTPNFDLRKDLRNKDTDLQERINEVRKVITGGKELRTDFDAVTEELVDSAIPTVPLETFIPSTNPSTLYQQLKNLSPGQRVYSDTSDYVERSNAQLTELARFLGHYSGPRKQPLNSDQIKELRYTYGSIYDLIGYPIDSKAIKQYLKTGVAKVETKKANKAVGTAQETQIIRRAPETEVAETPQVNRINELEEELQAIYDRIDPEMEQTNPDLLLELDARAADVEQELGRLYVGNVTNSGAYKAFEKVLPDAKKPNTKKTQETAALLHKAEEDVTESMDRVRYLSEELTNLERMVQEDMQQLYSLPKVEATPLDIGSYESGLMNERVLAAPQQSIEPLAAQTNSRSEMIRSHLGIKPIDTSGGTWVNADGVEMVKHKLPTPKYLEEMRADGSLADDIKLLDKFGVKYADEAEAVTKAGLLRGRFAYKYDDATRAIHRDELNALPPEAFERTVTTTDTPANTQILYHGTKFDVANLRTIDASLTNPTRNTLGLGHYFTSDPSLAEDMAKAAIADNVPVSDLPVNEVGRVREVATKVQNSLDANGPITPEIKQTFVQAAKDAGFDDAVIRSYQRRLGKTKDKTPSISGAWNKLAAAYAKVEPDRAMPEDLFRQFEVNVQDSLTVQGFDSVVHRTGDNTTLVVFGDQFEELAKADIGDGSLTEQATAAFNVANAQRQISNDVVSKTNALSAKIRMGVELQKKVAELLEDAANRADTTITRMLEADDIAEATVRKEKETSQLRKIQDGRKQFAAEIDDIIKHNDEYPGCL